jgi:hypothetical protein
MAWPKDAEEAVSRTGLYQKKTAFHAAGAECNGSLARRSLLLPAPNCGVSEL